MTEQKEKELYDEMTKIVAVLLDKDQTYDETQRLYTEWAKAGTYEAMIGSHKQHYAGPFVIREMVQRLIPTPGDEVVLDLGSGTGVVGKMLQNLGFKTIHALEPNEEFITMSTNKGVYQKVMPTYIGGGTRVDAENDTYDAIVTVGTFCPGHIPCDALHEIIRIIKPGGYFINCMREEFMSIVPEYKDRLEPLMNQLVAEGKWKKAAWERYDNHYKEKHGIVMAFQIC